MGKWFRSEIKAFAASSSIIFPVNFLDAARSMRAPVITKVCLRGSLNITTPAGVTGLARAFPQVLTRIRVTDGDSERVNMRGSSARVQNILEKGAAYTEGTNVPAASTLDREFWLEFCFDPFKARRRADFGIPLFEFVDGGQLELQTGTGVIAGTAGNMTVNVAATSFFQFWVYVEEGRKRELKSRLKYWDMDITQTEFAYPVGGALRSACYYAGEGTEVALTALAAQNFTSRTLEHYSFPRDVYRQFYKLNQAQGYRAQDAAGVITVAEDPFITQQVVMAYGPEPDQKITEMPLMLTLHWQTDGTVPATTPKFIFSAIIERSPGSAAKTLQANTPDEVSRAILERGTIKTAQGKTVGVKDFPADIARVLPIKLK